MPLQNNQSSESELILYSIVALHALTIPKDAEMLQKSKIGISIILLACGINKNNV